MTEKENEKFKNLIQYLCYKNPGITYGQLYATLLIIDVESISKTGKPMIPGRKYIKGEVLLP